MLSTLAGWQGTPASRLRQYYITDRRRCPGSFLDCIEANAAGGCDWIQIREKDLRARDLVSLVRAAVARARPHGTAVLVNSRVDVALVAGAGGVHLTSTAPSPRAFAGILPPGFLVAVSTHSVGEIREAERHGADFVVFGPVYKTPSKPELKHPAGLAALRAACRSTNLPVAALGGLTPERAVECSAAGAAAIAGISMYQSRCC